MSTSGTFFSPLSSTAKGVVLIASGMPVKFAMSLVVGGAVVVNLTKLGLLTPVSIALNIELEAGGTFLPVLVVTPEFVSYMRLVSKLVGRGI